MISVVYIFVCSAHIAKIREKTIKPYFINLLFHSMRKNLFFAAALALVSFASVAAQDTQVWARTVACGQGEAMTTEKGKAMHKGSTPLINNAGATGVRFTVIETAPNSEIKGGGPCFALGEMQVLNAAGEPIEYYVTSNADHNTMGGAGNDGQGYSALSDGIIEQANYWHSTWSTAAPADYHYLEFTFTEPVDAYQLVWYTRPGSDKNNPTVVGLTNPGDAFTAEMLYAEYNFSVGAQVEEIDPSKFYVIKSNSPVEYNVYNRETGEVSETKDDGTGPRYLSSVNGSSVDASPASIARFIPTGDGETYLLQWAISGAYVGAGSYGGVNGWAGQTSNLYSAVPVKVTKDGDKFKLSYEILYNNELTELYLGADPRESNNGRLIVVDKTRMEENEAKGWCDGFSLVLSFNYTVYEANVADGLLPEVSIDLATAAEKMFGSTVEKAEYYYEQYTSKPDSIWLALNLNDGNDEVYAEWWSDIMADYESDVEDFSDILSGVKAAVAGPESFSQLYSLKLGFAPNFSYFLSFKADWYTMWIEAVTGEDLDGYPFSEYPNYVSGTYPATQKAVLEALIEETLDPIVAAPENYSVAQIEAAYESCNAAIAGFLDSRIKQSEFPAILELSGVEKSNDQGGKNMHCITPEIMLPAAINGVRVTFLDREKGSAADEGNYPMIALGELELRDGSGNKVELTEANFTANYTETQEGFESTVARLCDGVLGGAGSYYHSPWSGNEPQEYICIDIQFPSDMDVFSLNFIGRCNSTTNGNVHSLYPTKVALTKYGEAYDPVLFAEREWNEAAGEIVTSVDQITDDGLYLIRGMLWENAAAGATDAEGNPLPARSRFMTGVGEHHSNIDAARANCAYLIRKVAGTDEYTIYSLNTAQYWASSTESGFIGQTADVAKAAKVKIVPANSELENTFVIYEYQEGRVTTSTVQEFKTPYSVYMHLSGGVAARATVNPQPGEGANVPYVDGDGDAYCFNKKNGEGEWQIYKFTMDHKEYYWLENLVALPEALGVKVGTDPGCVVVTDEYEAAFADAKAFIATSDTIDTTAKKHVDALLAQVAQLDGSKNPIVENTPYVFVAKLDYYSNTGNTMVMLPGTATIEGVQIDAPAWGAMPKVLDETVQYVFEKADVATENEAEAGNYYYIKNVALNQYIKCSESGIYFVYEKEGNHFFVNNVAGATWAFTRPGTNQALHQGGHNNGSGSGGKLFYWSQDVDASQWYIMSIDNFETEEPVAPETFALEASIFPAVEGELKEIKGIRVDANQGASLSEIPTEWTFTDEKGNSYEMNIQWLYDYESIIIMFKDSITKAGTYTLTIPEGSLTTDDGKICEAATFSWTIRNINQNINIHYCGEKNLNMSKRVNTLPFAMETDDTNLTAFQCNIQLPEGFSIAKNEDNDYDVTLNSARVTSSHTIAVEKQEDGSYLIVCYSSKNALIKGYTGELFYVNVEIDWNTEQGEYDIIGDRVIFSIPEGDEMEVNTFDCTLNIYRAADVNKDNNVNRNDIYEAVNAMYEDEYIWENLSKQAADMNQSGDISIIDIASIAEVSFMGYSERKYYSRQDDGSIKFGIGNNILENGKTIEFPLTITSSKDIIGIQCDLYISGNDYFEGIEHSNSKSHGLEARELSDGGYRIVLYPFYGLLDAVMDKDFATIAISRPANASQASNIEIKNLKVCTYNFEEYSFDDINIPLNTYKQGDANGDNSITIADIVLTVNALLGKSSDKFILSAADIDSDGVITIGDVVSIVNIMLRANNENAKIFNSAKLNDKDTVSKEYVNNRNITVADDFHVNNAIVNNDEATMIVKLDNADKYNAMQFDVNLPEGVSIKEVTVSGNHTVAFNENRVVAYSLTNSVFDADEDVMTITLNIEGETKNALVIFDNIYVTTTEFAETQFNSVGASIEGATGIIGTQSNVLKVYTENSHIVIEAQKNEVAEIVSANGVIYNVDVKAGKNLIAIEQRGLYVVKINNTVTKVRL